MISGKNVVLYTGERANIKTTSYTICPDKLKAILQKRNLMIIEVSKALGFAPNTLSGALKNGVISGAMVSGLKNIYGITLDEYEFKSEEKPTVPDQKLEEYNVASSGLYDTVKMAVLDAINEAFAANMKNLRGMMYTAMLQALRAKENE